MKNASCFILIILLLSYTVHGQEKKEKTYRFSGYLKDMASLQVPDGGDSVAIDNLIHNRLNFRWFPNKTFQLRVELRSRVFFGDFVSFVPNYSELIDVNNDYFDGSITIVNEDDLVIHSMIDRAYAEWKNENWSLQVGRQRINWGINLAWNPNDIFNAYSFFDFDYEERPGSDAIRFQKYRGYAGGYEIAIKMADSFEELTAGYLHKWNKNNYDFQLLTGIMRNNLVLGGGWAGNLGNAGFKGEMTWFEPLDNEQEQTFLGALSADYSFASSVYINGSLLYNSSPLGNGDFTFASSGNLDVRSLSPFKWSTFVQVSLPLHPLLNFGMSTMIFPGNSGVFINPFLTWNLMSNLDLDLIGQLFLDESPNSVYVGYLRLKWSF